MLTVAAGALLVVLVEAALAVAWGTPPGPVFIIALVVAAGAAIIHDVRSNLGRD